MHLSRGVLQSGIAPNTLGLRGKVEVYVVTVHIADAVVVLAADN